MLTVITDQTTINTLYQKFHQILARLFPIHRPAQRVGHQGGATDAEVYSTPEGDLWTCASAINWNPFGLGENPSMVVQINFSDGSTTRKSIGVFAEDEDGQVVVLHRGNIGGGKVGVSKALLMEHSLLPRETVLDGDQEIEMLVVGQLRSPLFGAQLRQFVAEVHRVKHLHNQEGLGGLATSLFLIAPSVFKSETSGYSKVSPAKRRASYRTHGLIVEALKQQLQRRLSGTAWRIFNDRHRDLILTHNEKIIALFEIKTVATTQDVATALGQLLLYGAAVPSPLRRIMVLPEPLHADAVRYLNGLGVECLFFSGTADAPAFDKLPSLLKSFSR